MDNLTETTPGVVQAAVQYLKSNTLLAVTSSVTFSALLLIVISYLHTSKRPDAKLLPGPKGELFAANILDHTLSGRGLPCFLWSLFKYCIKLLLLVVPFHLLGSIHRIPTTRQSARHTRQTFLDTVQAVGRRVWSHLSIETWKSKSRRTIDGESRQ